MPKRRKLPSVSSYPAACQDPDKLLVQKTSPLMSLSETDISLTELKILDVYLSKIDSHDPENRFIRLDKGLIEELLGVTRIKSPDLEKRIENLFQTVTIRDENKPKGFTKIALFEKAQCYQDDDGLWQVELGASKSAMEYIFYPEALGYLRYRLANVVNLTSRYSYILFLYLADNRFRSTWEISLDELKNLLRCNAPTYGQYYRFNELVLQKCYKELNEKTSLRYTYEPVKQGRVVKAIRFTIITTKEITGSASASGINEKPDPLSEACDGEFSEHELRVLMDLILQMFPQEEASDEKRIEYLRLKYHVMQFYSKKKPIAKRFNYIKTLIENDILEKEARAAFESKYFCEKTYDTEDLERLSSMELPDEL